jgi:hypothetical protein
MDIEEYTGGKVEWAHWETEHMYWVYQEFHIH